MLAQRFVAVANLALTGQEHQYVALISLVKNLVDRFHYRIFNRYRLL